MPNIPTFFLVCHLLRFHRRLQRPLLQRVKQKRKRHQFLQIAPQHLPSPHFSTASSGIPLRHPQRPHYPLLHHHRLPLLCPRSVSYSRGLSQKLVSLAPLAEASKMSTSYFRQLLISCKFVRPLHIRLKLPILAIATVIRMTYNCNRS